MKKVSKKKTVTKKVATKKVVPVKAVKKGKRSWGLLVLAIANILAFAGVLIVNYLAVNLPIGGMTTGALADLYPNLFTPAGFTFSIWGLIYFFLLGFVIWQIIDLYRKQSSGMTKKIGVWFILSCLTNIGRIFAWHNTKVLLSAIILVLFLITLIVIANKVQIGKKVSIRNKILVQVPFSLYLGWLSVAVIANISAWLVTTGWTMLGMTDIFWTIIVIVVATLLALRNLYKKHNIIFALVVVWAFVGIVFKRLQVDPMYAKNILWTLGICIAILAAGIGRKIEEWRKN